jgi:hypothetical protein
MTPTRTVNPHLNKQQIMNLLKKCLLFALLSIQINLTAQGVNTKFLQTPNFENVQMQQEDDDNIIITALDGTVFELEVGDEENYRFTASNVSGAVLYDWTISPAPPDGLFALNYLNASRSEMEIIYTPNAEIACPGSSYSLSVTRGAVHSSLTPVNLTACATAPPAPSATPIDIMVVLDISGSMGEEATCSGGSPGSSDVSKLEYVKSHLISLFNQMAPGADRPDDRFGLVAFETNATYEISLQLYTSARTELTGLAHPATGLQPQSMTAIGKGLQMAIEQLRASEPTHRKLILMLSNGVQTEPPYVEQVGDQLFVDANENGTYQSGTDFNLTNTGITIIPYAIFTPNESYRDLLTAIVRQNGGSHAGLTESPHVCNVMEGLTADWITAYRSSNTPKFAHFRRGRTSGTNGVENFSITEKMNQLRVGISGAGTHNFNTFKVEKVISGTPVEITGFGTTEPPLGTTSQHRVFKVDFPINAGGSGTFDSEGEYRVTFSSTINNTPYSISVILDDRGLKQGFFANDIVPAGDKAYFGAHLFQSGAPVTDAKVKAIIYAPRERLGNAFSKKRVPGQYISVSRRKFERGYANTYGGTVKRLNDADGYIKQITISHPTLKTFQTEGSRMENGDKKYQVLFYETDFAKVFEYQPIATVPLHHVSNGVYRATYEGFDKVGLYKILFEAEGSTVQVGKFKRFEEKTPLVRFGTPNLKRSGLYLLYERPLILSMKPVDTEGNLLGPNNARAISITLSSGTASELTDYLDGRYVTNLNLSSPDDDPNVTIRIHDRILYDGPLSDIGKKRSFFSLSGGITVPQSPFNTGLNSSFFVEGRLGHRFTHQWGAQLKGGYYHFNGKAGGSDLGIGSIGGGVIYRRFFNFAGGFYPQLELNAAGYKPESADWEFGWNGGLNLGKPLSHFLNLILTADYHSILTEPDNTNFLAFGLGLQVRF